MTVLSLPKRAKPPTVMLQVIKGGFAAADRYSQEQLKAKNFRIGDVLSAELKLSRNPKFHRLVHSFGEAIAQNIENFSGMDAHRVLKRLQWEGNIGCDEMWVDGGLIVRIPRSLSFENMDEGEFNEVYAQFRKHVERRYWPGLTDEQAMQMEGFMEDAA